MIKTYKIQGMTCGHCTAAVSDEINEVPGVTDVVVNLDNATAQVSGHDFTDAQITEAVEEAGYTIIDD